MKKIKIFQFPIRNSNGGITHYAMNNWKYLDKSKFDCDFGTVSKVIDFETEILASGAGLKYISCYAEENQDQFVKEIRELFLEEKYDVVHLHTSFWKSFLVEKIALQCGIPKIIVHAHSTRADVEDDKLRREAEVIHNLKKKEFNTSLATHFCACSHAAADWIFGEQIPRDRIKILKNAIDVDEFAFDPVIREKYRIDLGLKDCFVIGDVGRFSFAKNHKFLIDVFNEISKMVKNTHLLLVGDGPLEKEIKEHIRQLGLSNKVTFLGARSDINSILQAMDVFCLPSYFEGMPMVIIEAQAAGLQCIVSDTISSEVEITDSIKRLPLDLKQWKHYLLFMIKSRYQRRRNKKVIAEAGYSIKKEIVILEKLYRG